MKEVVCMLLSFRVRNYKSIADEMWIDLRATKQKDHLDTLINSGKEKFLPVIAIYGANASGKSNIFKAISAMMDRIEGKLKKDVITSDDIAPYIVPYMFDETYKNGSTLFEIEQKIDKIEYRYGFVCTKQKVYEEWLFMKKDSKEECVFYRNDETLEMPFENKEINNEVSHCYSMTSENDLLITGLNKRASSNLKMIQENFKTYKLAIKKGEENTRNLEKKIGILHLFSNINMFDSISFDFSNDKTESVLIDGLGRNLYKLGNANRLAPHKMVENIKEMVATVDSSIVDVTVEEETDSDLNIHYRVYTHHLDNNGKKVKVNFDIESNGTRKFIALYSWIFLSLNNGFSIVCDEIDIKLHPLLLRRIIRMFTDKEQNPKGAQLIFSAHNLICLDSSDLRRDEIYFVEKNNQKTEIYPMSDIKIKGETVRADLDFGKNYLTGRFGAIPFND